MKDEYQVEAETERQAIELAKEQDKTKFSIYESYADWIDEG